MFTTAMGHAAWALTSLAVSSAVVRLVLGVLTVHAARKALGAPAAPKAADRLRAHHLAVLRALLNGLKPPRR